MSATLKKFAEPRPRPGWNGGASVELVNPRPPAAPADLNLNLEKYYAACALIGLLSAQNSEPDKDWAVDWSLEVGAAMARKAKKRWG